MRLIDPDEPCACRSGQRWAECCAQRLPLTLRYVPVRLLSLDDPVSAGCQQGGHCCWNVHVPLSPFDVLRLARHLELSTGDLLSEFAVVTAEGGVEIEGTPHCPFLQGTLCSVYSSRPDSCRMYPFWRLSTGESEWLVERHTCSGCWQECRSESTTASDLLAGAGVDAGREAETLYESLLLQMEAAGEDEEKIEEVMARAYDSDSVPTPADAEADLPEHFRQVLRRLNEEYR